MELTKLTDHEKSDAFMAALTDLSAQYGIGITGTPVLFTMEHDDSERIYRVNDESELSFE